MPDLLIELFSEEIPARMQTRAADDLKKRMTDALVEAGITYAGAAAFATPRRLTLTVEGLLAVAPTTREERKGPRVDAPEKAIEGFLRSTGLTRAQLTTKDDKKGQVFMAEIVTEGRPAADVAADALRDVILNFPWPKSMRWGSGNLRWVRPLHSILAILSDESGTNIIDPGIDGVPAGDTTEGHRFMAPNRFSVASFEDYEAKLKKAHVILRSDERAAIIANDAAQMAFAQGLELVEDQGLLAEVAGLVEWPVVLMSAIGDDFLGLPPEVLQTSMKEHQKFFSVRNPKTGRIEKYVTVANRETADNGATILAGNDKVLSARLSDAKFFWENDLRVVTGAGGMTTMAAPLEHVTYHNQLGSVAERALRITDLAQDIAPFAGAEPAPAAIAAGIAKADLSSEMVYEFPELQGVMGRYYAEAAGHPAEIAAVAAQHYAPLGPSDDVPEAPLSVTVALADKIDALAGFWAIDEKPTGSKDPFALRRAALGVIRIILDNNLRLRLDRFIDAQLLRFRIADADDNRPEASAGLRDILTEIARHGVFVTAAHAVIDAHDAPHEHLHEVRDQLPDVSDDLLNFIHDRLKVHLRNDGIRHDVIDACIAMEPNDDLCLLVMRVRALQSFLGIEDGQNLLQGYKRAANILAAEEKKDGVEYSLDPDPKLAENPAETALFAALDTAAPQIIAASEAEDFAGAMESLAGLRAPIDAFFDATMINADNAIIRRNRLCLLTRIKTVMERVAMFDRIEG